MLLALLSPWTDRPTAFVPEPIVVQLVAPPKPPAPPAPIPAPPAPVKAPAKTAAKAPAKVPVKTSTPPKAAPAKPPPRTTFRPVQGSPRITPLAASDRPTIGAGDEVSEAELAGAATGSGSGSGSGGGGGGGGGDCNMPARLQSALRKSAMAQAAVANVQGGKAIRVWNGDWVKHAEQEGSGLAAVREAIMWEVAFAPKACRAQPVHGLVLLSMNDHPGAPRIVVGGGVWRWSDLLFARPSAGVDAADRDAPTRR